MFSCAIKFLQISFKTLFPPNILHFLNISIRQEISFKAGVLSVTCIHSLSQFNLVDDAYFKLPSNSQKKILYISLKINILQTSLISSTFPSDRKFPSKWKHLSISNIFSHAQVNLPIRREFSERSPRDWQVKSSGVRLSEI